MPVGFTHFIALCIGATSLAIPVAGLAAGPDPANYPALSTQQMGHVRHMINIANQLDGDFSLMGETERTGERSLSLHTRPPRSLSRRVSQVDQEDDLQGRVGLLGTRQ
jgi:hypothetical protein